MTRRSKREVERAIEEFRNGNDGPVTTEILYHRPGSDGLVDADGEPTEPDPETDVVIVIRRAIAMSRSRAEREGREILGPAEDAPDDVDVVEVAQEEA